jgi:peroxidase
MSCKNCQPQQVCCEAQLIGDLITKTYEYRNLDGSGNNRVNPSFGLIDKPFLREAPAVYNNNDGCSLNDLNGNRPNPRVLSNSVMKQTASIPNSKSASNILWVWGQFVDHDITLTHVQNGIADIPVTDPLDPLNPAILFTRSASVPDDNNCNQQNPKEQINSLSPFINASNVYGASLARNNYIREFCDGRIKVVSGNLPPYNDTSQEDAGALIGPTFVCGDIRANENVCLTSMHTLFVREHNHWATQISEAAPKMSDEEIYQRAKIMVEAEIEAITFNEFLPLVLGNPMPPYKYDSGIDPQLTNEFSAAAYRFGHSLLPTEPVQNLELRDMFFASYILSNQDFTICDILRQLSAGTAEELDHQVVDDIRNFLFGDPGNGGADLVALNIQRGRDHGIAPVNDLLTAHGLPTITRFSDITPIVSIQTKLASLYKSPTDIDVWVYGLLEPKVGNSMVGPLFNAIISGNFVRLRDGDRLWYENRLTCTQIDLINSTRLSDIINRNACCKVAENVFVVNFPQTINSVTQPSSIFYKHSKHYTGVSDHYKFGSRPKVCSKCAALGLDIKCSTIPTCDCHKKCDASKPPKPPPMDRENKRCQFSGQCSFAQRSVDTKRSRYDNTVDRATRGLGKPKEPRPRPPDGQNI